MFSSAFNSAKNSLASASEQALPILSSSTKVVTDTLDAAKETAKTQIGVKQATCENWGKDKCPA